MCVCVGGGEGFSLKCVKSYFFFIVVYLLASVARMRVRLVIRRLRVQPLLGRQHSFVEI